MKYLFIDGNNLAIRCAFANEALSNKEGVPTGVHFGVFQSLINLKQSYPEHRFLIVWDGKSKRRMLESRSSVESGLIKSAYKENRKKDEQPKPLLDFFAQSSFLKKGIQQTGIPQIRLEDYESDDVIASYCKIMKDNNEIVVVTSDEDYMQILDNNVAIYDGMKQKTTTQDSWKKENGVDPKQHVDIGALMGDTGDNIFGVYGVGEKTALKLIQEHGTYQGVYAFLHKEYDQLRIKYPDLKEEDFKKLASITTKSGEAKYPEITFKTPFTGVVWAVENKEIKPIPKTTLMMLMFEERVKLAYSLKKMDDDIPNLPEIKQEDPHLDKLIEYLDYYDIESLKMSIEVFNKEEV